MQWGGGVSKVQYVDSSHNATWTLRWSGKECLNGRSMLGVFALYSAEMDYVGMLPDSSFYESSYATLYRLALPWDS